MPGVARAGLFHEGRYYETDGERALGIHDLSKLRLLPPISAPPSLRIFQTATEFVYANPAGIVGPLAEVEIPTSVSSLVVAPAVAWVIKDEGRFVDEEEALGFVIGLSPCLVFSGEAIGPDRPLAIGPFLATIDDFPALEMPGAWGPKAVLKSGDATVLETSGPLQTDIRTAIRLASQTLPVKAGDVLVVPYSEPGASVSRNQSLTLDIEGFSPLVIKTQ